jgi:hypothetical protein
MRQNPPVVHVHQFLGGFVVGINLLACVWAFLVYRGTITPGRAFTQVLALSHTLIVAQALIGLLLLASQHRAPVQLHYLYGFAPAVAVLFGYSSRTEDPRRNTLVFAFVALAATLLGARAFMTGMGWG